MITRNESDRTSYGWIAVKLVLIALSVIFAPLSSVPACGDVDISSYVAAFLLPIVSVPLVIRWYLSQSKGTASFVSRELVWRANPFCATDGPLPFFHLAAWVMLAGGISGGVFSFLSVEESDVSVHIFGVSAGTALLLGIWLTCRKAGAGGDRD